MNVKVTSLNNETSQVGLFFFAKAVPTLQRRKEACDEPCGAVRRGIAERLRLNPRSCSAAVGEAASLSGLRTAVKQTAAHVLPADSR